MTTVLIVDDNPVVRAGLVSLLGLVADVEVVGEASSARDAVARARQLRPDVVFLDVRMPGGDGTSVVAELATQSAVCMLTHTADAAVVREALSGGAIGYLVHGSFTVDELAAAVRRTADRRRQVSPEVVDVLMAPETAAPCAVAPADVVALTAGRHGLSARETEILRHIVEGRSNGEIASMLFIEPKTVKNHVNRIFAKLGVDSRARAMAYCTGRAINAH